MMKNKFQALAEFVQWPKDWQRLCVLVWAESEEPRDVRFDARQLAIEPPKKTARPDAVASIQAGRPIYRGDFGIAEREYLAKCHYETRTRRQAANMFLDRYPGRSVQAVEIKIRKMLDANGVMHVRY